MRFFLLLLALCAAGAGCSATPAASQTGAQRPAHPDFKPTPEQNPMPKSLLVVKRTDLKNLIETAFNNGAKAAAGGERVRFPVIGALVRREVKARKAGKGVNPFTGESMDIKARPATKKPRWSFPRSLKDTFANKRFW